MADANSSDSDQAVIEGCIPSTDYLLFNQISMGPAVVIIIVLMFTKRRTKKQLMFLDGRPALLPPVDFLGSEENRFSYALAYGSMAVSVTNLFFKKLEGKEGGLVVEFDGPSWTSAFRGILSVILLGIVYLPFFVCLSTHAKLLGSLFGFLYTGYRLAAILLVLLECPIIHASVFPSWPIFFDLPVLLSHVFLIGRYVFIFVTEVKKICSTANLSKNRSTWTSICCGEEEDKLLAPEEHKQHVRGLLTDPDRSSGCHTLSRPKLRALHIKVRDFVYVPPRADFKYPVPILSTVLVAGVIIYEMVILIAGDVIGRLIHLRDDPEFATYMILTQGPEFYDVIAQFLNISIGSLLASTVVSALFAYFQMYRLLKAHRHHVLKLFASNRTFLPSSLPNPANLVGLSLRFCGYQIAHFLWGFLILVFILVVLTVAISFAVLLLPALLTDEFKGTITQLIVGLVPVLLMAIFVWLVQKLLAMFVFSDRSIKSKVVHINNRRCYLVMTFFFFFFNILVGMLSCFLRIIKGMVFGILFIGRIDRPLLMKGFQQFDTAYMAYLGFLHVQVAHKHPVILVFCQLLWNKVLQKRTEKSVERFVSLGPVHQQHSNVLKDTELEQITNTKQEARIPGKPRVSRWALNKWFLAITMIRNPTLIPNRKGFFTRVVLGATDLPVTAAHDNAVANSPDKAEIPADGSLTGDRIEIV